MQQAATFGKRGLAPVGPGRPAYKPAVKPAAWSQPASQDALQYDQGARTRNLSDAEEVDLLSHLPLVTGGLLLLLLAMFFLEQVVAFEPPQAMSPSYRSLMALGGVNGRLVFHDLQAWRIFTAPLLHGGATHLFGNALVMGLVGWWLERLMGRAWFAATFALSAIGGSIASIALNPSGPVSIGASGAITGLLAAAFVCSFHIAAFETRGKLRWLAIRLIIPALIPTSAHTDYSCHLGGAVTGVVIGFALQFVWPEMQERPNFGRLANLITGGWALATAAAFGLIAVNFPAYAERNARLAPDADLPASSNAPGAASRWAALAAAYPRDPRPIMVTAVADSSRAGLILSEAKLRKAMADTDILDNDMPPAVREGLEISLSMVLLEEGRMGEARTMARGFCTKVSKTPDPSRKKLAVLFQSQHLCDPN